MADSFDRNKDVAELLALGLVIPVIVIEDENTAVPMAQALVGGGLRVLEVTLRTPAGLPGIKRIAEEVPDAVVGAGTVLTPADVSATVAAGARFLVSPGSSKELIRAMLDSGALPLPGTATASEVMALLDQGLNHMKFFPAQPAGGVPYLKSLAGPLPMVRFCPTGGITPETAPQFLALKNVACVGGSWMLPADALAAGDWARVRDLAQQAAGLGQA
jgi:2-dehydro-3-deoxyphosphogluconate aldolase / (4S)-4-hydroxy-2-oxoglutarate aldolase